MSEPVLNLELSVQIIYVEERILVVCTGNSGESYSFIEKSNVEKLIKYSLEIHQFIDKLIKINDRDTMISNKDRNEISHNLQHFGKFVFECIFTNETLDLFNFAIGQSLRFKQNMTIKLMIADDFLNLVPWEVMFNDGEYVSHVYNIVRHPFISQPVRINVKKKKF